MKLDFAFICDYAEVANKIYALGIGFDTIYAPQLPWKHSHFCLVAQLRASRVETGQKKVAIHLIDEDGNDIITPAKGEFTVPKTPAAESLGRFAMHFANVEFSRYGSYSVRVVIEQIEMVEVSFKVIPPPSTSTG